MSKIIAVPLGICHSAWDKVFYPEDLPVSWKLSYFANEFSVCCLTLKDVEILSSEDEDFAENLPEGFRCILYVDEPQLPDVCSALLAHIESVIIVGSVSPDELSQIRENYGQGVKIYSLEPDRLPLCHTFQVHAQLHCHLVSATEAQDLRSLKGEVAKWLKSDANEIFILVDCGTDIVLLRNVTTLVSLLA